MTVNSEMDDVTEDLSRMGTLPFYLSSLPQKAKAPHLGHSNHLCDMVDRGVDITGYKTLVKNPKFLCKKCGRVAAKEENLCESTKL